MKIVRTVLDNSFVNRKPFPEHTALFDIETTGLSADMSYLYLIGVIFKTDEGLTLMQWFCDDFSEEKELLILFRDFLEDYPALVHYNGSGFDIPYLNKKFARHKIMPQIINAFASSPYYSIPVESTTDIYKLLLPYKKALSFPDFRQKTLEVCCGFSRTDTFDGGDLIAVYAAYTGKYRLAKLTGKCEEADALRTVLLLHNHDDLLGLLALFQHTALQNIADGTLAPEITITETSLEFYYAEPVLPFPGTFSLHTSAGTDYETSLGSLTVTAHDTTLSLQLFSGELKYFFADYKNYTYLVYEDTAVHNSLAEYVDKEAKQKCKPATAYQKKQGTFLPLPLKKTPDFTGHLHLFYREYKKTPAFLELAELKEDEKEILRNYAVALFAEMGKISTFYL